MNMIFQQHMAAANIHGMRSTPDINAGKAAQLGPAIRAWRTLRRLKQTHVAELLRVSQTTLSRWENGVKAPNTDERQAIVRLIACGLDSAADAALARLVSQASSPIHLVCDFSHRLLACSRAREGEFRASKSELLGRSLWPYATEEITDTEASLADIGWFEPAPPAVELHTSARLDQAVPIPESRVRWTRMRLSNGDFVRLVETLPR